MAHKFYYKITKSSADNNSVFLRITDAFFRRSSGIIIAGQCQLTGVCVSSDVTNNIGLSYHATLHFIYKNENPFVLLDSAIAYEYYGMPIVSAAMETGETDIGVIVSGTNFGTTNNLFIWDATFLLTYIQPGIGS